MSLSIRSVRELQAGELGATKSPRMLGARRRSDSQCDSKGRVDANGRKLLETARREISDLQEELLAGIQPSDRATVHR